MKRFLIPALFLILLIGDAGLAALIPGNAFSASAQQQTDPPPSGDLDTFHDDVDEQIEKDKKSIFNKLDDILDVKVFQTNVFFGVGVTIFIALTIIFLLSMGSNIFGSGVSGAINAVKSLFGMKTGIQTGMVSPMTTAGRGDSSGNRYQTRQSSSKISSTKKKFMFCEVLTSFVNPGVKMDVVKKALTAQKKRKPRPLIGDFLKEHKLITDEDVSRTLDLQKKYRKRN